MQIVSVSTQLARLNTCTLVNIYSQGLSYAVIFVLFKATPFRSGTYVHHPGVPTTSSHASRMTGVSLGIFENMILNIYINPTYL